MHPTNADAVLGKFFFQQALVLEHHRDRIVGRPIDADFRRLVGGTGRAAESKRCNRCKRCAGGACQDFAAMKHDDLQICFFHRSARYSRQSEKMSMSSLDLGIIIHGQPNGRALTIVPDHE